MKRYSHRFLGSLLPVLLVACSTDPGINGEPGTGSTNGSGKGGKGGSGGSSVPGGSLGFGDPKASMPTVRGGASGGTDPLNTGEGKACALEKFELERNPPELLLVLDRSGSMTSKDARLTSRWVETTAALDATLKATENVVSWGLKMFPTPGMGNCGVGPGVEEDVRPANYMMVFGRINAVATAPAGNTPTAAAITAGTAYLKTRTTKNPKFIVLATDGEPNCEILNPGASGRAAAVAAIDAAAVAGYKTYVIGIATAGSNASTTLDQMADAGQTPRMAMPRYYPVNTRQDLIMVLNTIAGQISSCVFPLSKAPPSMNAAVKIDGVIVTKDPANGWSYGAGDKSIQLNGTSCERLRSAQKADVSITFACPGVIID